MPALTHSWSMPLVWIRPADPTVFDHMIEHMVTVPRGATHYTRIWREPEPGLHHAEPVRPHPRDDMRSRAVSGRSPKSSVAGSDSPLPQKPPRRRRPTSAGSPLGCNRQIRHRANTRANGSDGSQSNRDPTSIGADDRFSRECALSGIESPLHVGFQSRASVCWQSHVQPLARTRLC